MQLRPEGLVRGKVGRFGVTVGPNRSPRAVHLVLEGTATRGVAYRTVEVGRDADAAAACVVAGRHFTCTFVLEPGEAAQLTIRLRADTLNAPRLARQQLAVTSTAADVELDSRVSLTTNVVRADSAEQNETGLLAASIVEQPGGFVLLLALLLYALATTVAERRQNVPVERP